jgi:hypothetical protein
MVDKIKIFEIPNFGILMDTVPKDLFKKIKEECLLRSKKEIMLSGVTGTKVADHYYLQENLKELNNYLITLVAKYNEKYAYIKHHRVFQESTPLTMARPWYNMQKRYEFFPNHVHDGVLSFSMWIKIPYNIKKEKQHDRDHVTSFEFNYPTVDGKLVQHRLPIDKSYEGKIIMFPAGLTHCVYPFYTVDDIRISVSGNMMYDPTKISNNR